jgi:hypothetical protein
MTRLDRWHIGITYTMMGQNASTLSAIASHRLPIHALKTMLTPLSPLGKRANAFFLDTGICPEYCIQSGQHFVDLSKNHAQAASTGQGKNVCVRPALQIRRDPDPRFQPEAEKASNVLSTDNQAPATTGLRSD